jgi:hypothetical protein
VTIQLSKLERRFDLEKYLEQFDGYMSGDNFVTHCPTCDKDGKLYVLTKAKPGMERGAWICYRCQDTEGTGSGRSCVSLIEWMEDLSFVDAIKRLAEGGTSADADFIGSIEKLMKEMEERGEVVDEVIPEVSLPREFHFIDAQHYPPYCIERGISLERAMRFKLGYARSGVYRNRLIAPVYFDDRCVGFQARWMAKKPPMCTADELPCMICKGKDEHKRLPKTKHAKRAKMSKLLYNYDVARHHKRIVLVEDPWSAIHIGASGTASFGTHVSQNQFELLLKSSMEELVIIYDRDDGAAIGKSGYEKALAFAQRIASIVPVRCVRMPDDRDPDEHSIKSLRKLVERTPVLSAQGAWVARQQRRFSAL